MESSLADKTVSRRDRPSLTDPSEALAINDNASVPIFAPSSAATSAKNFISSLIPTLFKSNLWQRERIVNGTLFTSVVAKINLTCSGGSSRVFKRALNALLESI